MTYRITAKEIFDNHKLVAQLAFTRKTKTASVTYNVIERRSLSTQSLTSQYAVHVSRGVLDLAPALSWGCGTSDTTVRLPRKEEEEGGNFLLMNVQSYCRLPIQVDSVIESILDLVAVVIDHVWVRFFNV